MKTPTKHPKTVKRKAKTLTFSKQFVKTMPRNEVLVGYVDLASYLKARLLKQGYVVKNLRTQETITVDCIAARANVPLAERRKMQDEIDKMPVVDTFPLTNNKKKS